jgi:hypothetical protein
MGNVRKSVSSSHSHEVSKVLVKDIQRMQRAVKSRYALEKKVEQLK